jgi:hypothetical protein
MAFSELKGNSYEEYRNSLSAKYEKVTTISKYFPPSNATRQLAGYYQKCNLNAALFKKGETNVYLIRSEIYFSGMHMLGVPWVVHPSTNTYLTILYLSESQFDLIKNEIEKKRAKELSDEKEKMEKAKESDLNKIQ